MQGRKHLAIALNGFKAPHQALGNAEDRVAVQIGIDAGKGQRRA